MTLDRHGLATVTVAVVEMFDYLPSSRLALGPMNSFATYLSEKWHRKVVENQLQPPLPQQPQYNWLIDSDQLTDRDLATADVAAEPVAVTFVPGTAFAVAVAYALAVAAAAVLAQIKCHKCDGGSDRDH